MALRMIAFAAVAASLAAGAVYAANVGDFASLDTDKSAGLSLAEVEAASPEVSAAVFADADADKSGDLSAEEYAALKAASE